MSYDFSTGVVRFEFDDITIEDDLIDVFDVCLKSDDPLQGLKGYFADVHGKDLTTTQALRIKLEVTHYFLDFKKKLCSGLGSDTGFPDSMSPNLQTPASEYSTTTYQSCTQSESCASD